MISLKQLLFVALVFAVNINSFISAADEMGPRIVGGMEIQITQAPYQVSLRKKAVEKSRGYGNGHVCGGSVVSQRLIITAAHCVIDTSAKPPTLQSARDYTVVMGSAELYRANNYTLQYDVQELIPHPSFDTKTLENDIAALFINGYIPWNWATVSPIPLNRLVLTQSTMCMVTGWGYMNNGLIASVLRAGYVPIVSNRDCSINYGNIPIDMICAGYMNLGGVDACQGDSGGPLACDGVLCGVVSWGDGCGKVGLPGVYNNITHSYDWIIAVNRSFNYSYYKDSAFSNRQSTGTVILGLLFMTLVSGLLRRT